MSNRIKGIELNAACIVQFSAIRRDVIAGNQAYTYELCRLWDAGLVAAITENGETTFLTSYGFSATSSSG